MHVYRPSALVVLFQLYVLALAAPPIAPGTPPFLLTPQDASNPTTTNLTLPNAAAPLPPAPYIYRVPQSTIRIKFEAFGQRIPPSNTLHCLLAAANDVNLHAATPQRHLSADYQLKSASVRLVLYPAKSPHAITWAKWGATVRGISDFVDQFGFVDLDYYVLDEDVGWDVVAGGLISNR